MLLCDTCYTIIGLAYSALLPEISESDAERNGLQISASLFGLLGMILGFLIPDFFRPKAGAEVSFLPLQASMVAVALVSMTLILITTFRVKERPEFTRVDKPIPPGAAIRFTFTSKSFLILVSQNFMSILMQSLVLGMMFYLADYVLQMPTIVLLLCVFVPLIIGVPVTAVLRERFGVAGAQQVLLTIAGIGLTAIAFVPEPLILLCLAAAGFGAFRPANADQRPVRAGGR